MSKYKPRGCRFDCGVFATGNVNAHDHPGCEFLGILYDTGTEGWIWDLPKNGLDVLDTAVYWKLPYGTVKCWSLLALLNTTKMDF